MENVLTFCHHTKKVIEFPTEGKQNNKQSQSTLILLLTLQQSNKQLC